MRWLYDTSVFVGMESGRPMNPLPTGEIAVSVMTIGELQLAVQAASADDLSIRLETIAEAENLWTSLPADIKVMRRYASMVADCRRRGHRPRTADSIIAATASVHGLPLVTQDRGFERYAGIDLLLV